MAVNLSMLAGAGAQFFTDSGVPLTGGLVYTYAAGTTTPQAAYTTSAGNVAHTNPIVLNSAGRVASGGEIWLTDAVSYKFVLQTSAAVTIATYDNITGNASGIISSLAASSGSSLIGYTQGGAGAVATTVQAKLRQTVSVKDFGAVGDGTTNDTAAFAAATAYINANGGGHLIIPEGTYSITTESDPMLFTTGNVTIEGQGNSLIVARAFNGTSDLQAMLKFQYYGTGTPPTFTQTPTILENVQILNVNYNGNKTNKTTSGDREYAHFVNLKWLRKFVVSGCNAYNMSGDGIYTKGCSQGVISNNIMKDGGRMAVAMVGGEQINCSDNVLTNTNSSNQGFLVGKDGFLGGVDLEPDGGATQNYVNIENVVVSNNVIHNTIYGVIFYPLAGAAPYDADLVLCRGLVISGNDIIHRDDSSAAIFVRPTQNQNGSQGVSITGNTVVTDYQALSVYGMENVSIAGNMFRGGFTGATTAFASIVFSRNISCSGNTFEVESGKTNYGFQLSGAATATQSNVTFSNNSICMNNGKSAVRHLGGYCKNITVNNNNFQVFNGVEGTIVFDLSNSNNTTYQSTEWTFTGNVFSADQASYGLYIPAGSRVESVSIAGNAFIGIQDIGTTTGYCIYSSNSTGRYWQVGVNTFQQSTAAVYNNDDGTSNSGWVEPALTLEEMSAVSSAPTGGKKGDISYRYGFTPPRMYFCVGAGVWKYVELT